MTARQLNSSFVPCNKLQWIVVFHLPSLGLSKCECRILPIFHQLHFFRIITERNASLQDKINMNYAKEYFCEVFVYISLLALGLLMTKHSIDHYQDGKTYFTTDQTTISIADVPAVTICFENDQPLFGA